MASLQQRYNKWRAKVRIPKAHQEAHGGREFILRTLDATDRRGAQIEAAAWEAALKMGWAEQRGEPVSPQALRELYEATRREAVGGDLVLQIDTDADPVLEGIDHEIEKIADAVGPEAEPSVQQQARLAGLQDAFRERAGKRVKPRAEYEPSFTELSESYMAWWQGQAGLKPTNTAQQKQATYGLFAGYCRDVPIREITRPTVAKFLDALRSLDPNWAKSPEARKLGWAELQKSYGGHPTGLSTTTLNRHAATLKALWEWAADRGHCTGRNPFSGFNQRLKQGVNVKGYLPWTPDELKKLLTPPPKRQDLHELIITALHTGMGSNELASLRWADVREEEGVVFFQIEDAKTPAGNRQVPVHPALQFLLDRREGAQPEARLWPSFNPEGPGSKPGQDASREFSRFKASRGFTSRQKTFHSFRKNVTRQMERASVPENEWAQVLGHEKGFTYGRYNPDGITLQRKAELIGLIEYPGLELSTQRFSEQAD